MAAKKLKSVRPRIAMVSTHGYVAANPPLGAADTGGQVVDVLELSRKLAQLGFDVDIWTRRFDDQPEIDAVNPRVRVIRAPCGGPDFVAKEYLHLHLMEWCENALRYIEERADLPVHQQPLLGRRGRGPAAVRGARHPARAHAAFARPLEKSARWSPTIPTGRTCSS